VKPFQSVDELLQTVDAVSIAVPTEFHYEVGLACIRRNVHMLMEKPITSIIAQAKDLLHKASKAGVKLQMGHIELFNPFIQYLRKELEHEKIVGVIFKRLSPGDEKMKQVDVVKDLMIHDLYILHALLQDNTFEFYALGEVNENTPKHAVVITKSSQGVTAQLTASFKSKKKLRDIQILTENAFIEADILNRKIKTTRPYIEHTNNIPVPVTHTIKIDPSLQPLSVELLDFIQCAKSKAEPSVSGEEGLKALILSNEVSEHIRNQNNNG